MENRTKRFDKHIMDILTCYLNLSNRVTKWKNSNDITFSDWLVFGDCFTKTTTICYGKVRLVCES